MADVRTQAAVKIVDPTTDANAAGVDAAGHLQVDIAASSATVTVDTELPAAGPLADNMANPTTPLIGTCMMEFDGTNWDRVRQGPADDSAFSIAADRVAPIGYLADETAPDSVDEGDVGLPRMTLNRMPLTVLRPHTSGGISTVYRDEDIDEAPVAAKASAGQVYWIHCINFDATPVYLHFYDVAQASVTVGTTAELASFAVPSQGNANGAGFTQQFPHGIEFGTAITIACTTTIGGTVGPGLNEVILNVGYK